MNGFYITCKLAFRLAIVLATVILGVAFIFIGARSAQAANLKSSSMITENVLRVGDIFDGLEDAKADHVLGPAPQPGQNMTLNSRTLMRIALALELQWRPASSADQITIHRAATVISPETITDRISDELRSKGLSGKFTLHIAGQGPRITLPPEQSASFDVSAVYFDPQKDTFRATIKAPSAEMALAELTIAGKIERLVTVPVVTGNFRNGDIIKSHDITWIDVSSNSIQHNTVLKAEQLIGMSPRRFVESGKLIMDRDIERPQIISRGDTVTIIFQDGAITLTAKGRALEDGAAQDFIRVVNTTSNRSLEAQVTAEGTVIVSASL